MIWIYLSLSVEAVWGVDLQQFPRMQILYLHAVVQELEGEEEEEDGSDCIRWDYRRLLAVQVGWRSRKILALFARPAAGRFLRRKI